MAEKNMTLRGEWKRSTHVLGLPEHPIERTQIYKDYLQSRRGSDTARHALTRILRTIAPCTLRELTPFAVNTALAKLIYEGYAPSSVDRYRKMLMAFLSYAQIHGEVQINAAKQSNKVDMGQTKHVVLTVPAEVRTALDTYYLDPTKATVEDVFLWAAIRGGARISEPAMAVAGDIEIRKTAHGLEPYVWLGTKTDKRLVDFPDWSVPALMALLEAAMGDKTRPLLYLKGLPVSFAKGKETIRHRSLLAREQFYDVQRKLFGKPVANPHAFRSDYITRVLQTSRDPLVVEKLARRCGNSAEKIREYYWSYIPGAGNEEKLANM